MNTPTKRKRTDDHGRALAGSQLQIQLYVDRHRAELDAAIRGATGIVGELRWKSPVRKTKFREFKDRAFLEALGLTRLTHDLKAFWPSSGPRWDGLAVVEGASAPTVVLVEAKNYPREVRGGGCKASDVNDARARIRNALKETGAELGVPDTELWMGSLYQYANRIAHAAFLRRHGVESYLVNVCFFNDPDARRHTSERDWRKAASDLRAEVGFKETPSWLADVFLPTAHAASFLAVYQND